MPTAIFLRNCLTWFASACRISVFDVPPIAGGFGVSLMLVCALYPYHLILPLFYLLRQMHIV